MLFDLLSVNCSVYLDFKPPILFRYITLLYEMSHQDDLDPNVVGFEFVKEGADWLAIFNPKVPRQMDVKLAHKFTCEKCV